nr:hypothetical membrane protein [uncultured archaeon]
MIFCTTKSDRAIFLAFSRSSSVNSRTSGALINLPSPPIPILIPVSFTALIMPPSRISKPAISPYDLSIPVTFSSFRSTSANTQSLSLLKVTYTLSISVSFLDIVPKAAILPLCISYPCFKYCFTVSFCLPISIAFSLCSSVSIGINLDSSFTGFGYIHTSSDGGVLLSMSPTKAKAMPTPINANTINIATLFWFILFFIFYFPLYSPNIISLTIHKTFLIHKLTSLSLHSMNIPRVFLHLIIAKMSFGSSFLIKHRIFPCFPIILHQLLYSSPGDTIYRCNQLCAFTSVDYLLNCPFDLFVC